jgi:hypothetical protein
MAIWRGGSASCPPPLDVGKYHDPADPQANGILCRRGENGAKGDRQSRRKPAQTHSHPLDTALLWAVAGRGSHLREEMKTAGYPSAASAMGTVGRSIHE